MKVLIDLAWILYRAYHSNIPVSWADDDGNPIVTTTIYGVLQINNSLHKSFPKAQFYYCLEPDKNFRHEKKEYKEGRNSEVTGIVFGWQPEVLSLLNVFKRNHLLTAENGEADDVMWSAGQDFLEQGEQVYLHSGDNDLLPLMDKGALIFRKVDKGKPIFLTNDYVDNKYCVGIKPEMVPMFKIIAGDSGDTIPSVIQRFPRYLLLEICKRCKSVDELMDLDFNTLNTLKTQKEIEKLKTLKANEEQLRKNEHLVKLRRMSTFIHNPELKSKSYFENKYGLNSLKRIPLDEFIPEAV